MTDGEVSWPEVGHKVNIHLSIWVSMLEDKEKENEKNVVVYIAVHDSRKWVKFPQSVSMQKKYMYICMSVGVCVWVCVSINPTDNSGF